VLRVLICDDEEDRALELRKKLLRRLGTRAGAQVRALAPDQFVAAIAGLESRQLAAREPRQAATGTGQAASQHPFDTADIIFVDYDLLRLAGDGAGAKAAESGERVCYLARCYSECGVIVGYNQFSYGRTFDLTLRGHLRSFADLNISYDSGNDAGLWSDSYRGFRPWVWPILPIAYENLVARAEEISAVLDDPILATLGLGEEPRYRLLTRDQLEFLSTSKDPRTTTFREFVTTSGNGLRPKDVPWDDNACARIAASRIGKWLERAILPHQNILVDAPHLVSRFPSLLEEPDSSSALNMTSRFEVGLDDLGVDDSQFRNARFAKPSWLSRPAWVWPEVSGNESIVEVRDPWNSKESRYVFCEDTSRFRLKTDAREFVAAVAPEFARRYIQIVAGVSYEPAVRLLMQG